jgi:hypothetical protein
MSSTSKFPDGCNSSLIVKLVDQKSSQSAKGKLLQIQALVTADIGFPPSQVDRKMAS